MGVAGLFPVQHRRGVRGLADPNTSALRQSRCERSMTGVERSVALEWGRAALRVCLPEAVPADQRVGRLRGAEGGAVAS